MSQTQQVGDPDVCASVIRMSAEMALQNALLFFRIRRSSPPAFSCPDCFVRGVLKKRELNFKCV